MKLSISNIGWDAEQDEAVYRLMGAYGFSGLEIAPTRIFPEAPYSQREAAKRWSENLKAQYGFGVSSMQSIWYGRQEKLFGNEEERQVLLAYTKEAIYAQNRWKKLPVVFSMSWGSMLIPKARRFP